MGKNTDHFKGDSMRVRAKDRPFLQTGISMTDVQRFNEGKADRVVKIKPPRRNVKKASTIVF
jgi:hypothetical protein